MKSSEVLREAKRQLAVRKTSLCHAISWSVEGRDFAKAVELAGYILRSIEPYGLADRWLFERVCADGTSFNAWQEANKDHILEWRLLWLDRLIAEYEAKGD